MGDIAKSSDINHIQLHIKDSEKALLADLHDNEAYILGSGDAHKNAFILTAAPKELGRYIDSKNIFDMEDDFFRKDSDLILSHLFFFVKIFRKSTIFIFAS